MSFRVPPPPTPPLAPGSMGQCPKCHGSMSAIRYDRDRDMVDAACIHCGFAAAYPPKEPTDAPR